MSLRALVDTSALVAAVYPRDQYHAQAVAIGRRHLATGGRWVGTTLVLAEVHSHVLRMRGPQAASAHLTALLADPAYEWLEVSPALIFDALDTWLVRFADQRFSLTDAVSFEVMRREKISVAFAFDRHFVTAGFELLAVP